MKGLIIDEPWMSKILAGEKVWEMRSQATAVRGQIALIRKGSGAVVGVATLMGSRGPLTLDELRENASRHRVPMVEFESGRAIKWTVAWELAGVRALANPVGYAHPNGAVIWVNLDPGIEAQVQAELEDVLINAVVPSFEAGAREDHTGACFRLEPSRLVPVANDGTWFGPHLLRTGQFTVGEKGREQKLDSYAEALAALAAMDTPRWRRPNPKGNWGIVSGVRWVPVRDLGD